MTGFPLIIAFVLAIVVMIVAISKYKIHPFLSIMSVSLILALIAMVQLHAYLACAFAGRFTQQRLLISIISYFVLDFIGQLLFLLGVILFAVKVYPSLADISLFISTDSAILSSVCVVGLLVLLVDALLWALTQWLMTERLNLA